MKVIVIIIGSARGCIVVMCKKAGRCTEDGTRVNAQFGSEMMRLFLPMLLFAIVMAIAAALWFDDHLMTQRWCTTASIGYP